MDVWGALKETTTTEQNRLVQQLEPLAGCNDGMFQAVIFEVDGCVAHTEQCLCFHW